MMNIKNIVMSMFFGILLLSIIGIASANDLQTDVNQQLIIKTSCSGTDATADIQVYSGTSQIPDNLYIPRTDMIKVSPTDFTYTAIFDNTGIYTAYEECTYGGGTHTEQITTITVTEYTNLIKTTSYKKYNYEAQLYYDVYFKIDPTLGKTIRFNIANDSITFKPAKLQIVNLNAGTQQLISAPQKVIGIPIDNTFLYQNIYGNGIDLQYLVNTKYVKEEAVFNNLATIPTLKKGFTKKASDLSIELNSVMTTTTNKIIVDGKLWDMKKIITTSNKILIQDIDGNTIYQLQVPVAFDSNGAKVIGTYTLEKIGSTKKGNTKISVAVDMPYNWFVDTTRVYPIYLDPTIDTPDGTATFESGVPRIVIGDITIPSNEPYTISEQIMLDNQTIYDAECETDIVNQATGIKIVDFRSFYNDGNGNMLFDWGQPNTELNPEIGTYTLSEYCWHGTTLDLNKIYSNTTITVV